MTNFRVEHKQFETKVLEIKPGGLGAPKLILDGVVVQGKRGQFSVENDLGETSIVKFGTNYTGIPKVSIDGGAEFAVAPPLPWYAYALSAMPLVLIAFGGAIGGGLGACGAFINIGLFRSEHPLWLKILGAFIVTAIATLIYLVLAMIIQIAIN